MTQREKIEWLNKLKQSIHSAISYQYGVTVGSGTKTDVIDLILDKIPAQIETLITEGKVEEVKRLGFTVTATEKAIGSEGGNIKLETLEAYTKLRLGELQASLKGASNAGKA